MIPLPDIRPVSQPGAHPYPFQIGLQTLQFLHASFLYIILQDLAAGAFVREPGAIQRIESEMISKGAQPAAIELGWSFLQQYLDIFRSAVFQNALVFLNSHWDWYVRRLAGFIIFARNYVHAPGLSAKQQDELQRVAFKSVSEQLRILADASGVTFSLTAQDFENLKEMSLVRNLGLHNRWEVDDRYLERSARKGFARNEIRTFNEAELQGWHASLVLAVNETTTKVATRFAAAPDFPHI